MFRLLIKGSVKGDPTSESQIRKATKDSAITEEEYERLLPYRRAETRSIVNTFNRLNAPFCD